MALRFCGDAAAAGYITCCPAEKSALEEFDFEYGEHFAEHIEAFHPTFCKVLVRYNTEGDPSVNRHTGQASQAPVRLSAREQQPELVYVRAFGAARKGTTRTACMASRKAWDLKLRPKLMIAAIKELQDAGVEPDVWKIEGLDRREDCERIVSAARRAGRDKVGCIILGRGEDDSKVQDWLRTAAGVPGFIGFAVGRTTFWDPLVDWRAGRPRGMMRCWKSDAGTGNSWRSSKRTGKPWRPDAKTGVCDAN